LTVDADIICASVVVVADNRSINAQSIHTRISSAKISIATEFRSVFANSKLAEIICTRIAVITIHQRIRAISVYIADINCTCISIAAIFYLEDTLPVNAKVIGTHIVIITRSEDTQTIYTGITCTGVAITAEFRGILANSNLTKIIGARVRVSAINKCVCAISVYIADINCTRISIAAIFYLEDTLPVYAGIVCAGVAVIARHRNIYTDAAVAHI